MAGAQCAPPYERIGHTKREPQPDILEHFGNADAVPQLPERCLSRKAGIMRYCLRD